MDMQASRVARFWIPIGLGLALFAGVSVVGARHWRWRTELRGLERQLGLARADGEAGSVAELGRRLLTLDPSPARRLSIAQALLSAGNPAEALVVAEPAAAAGAPYPGEVARLRARVAQGGHRLEDAVRAWREYLGCSPARVDRIEALDVLGGLLDQLGQDAEVRACMEERLALSEGVEARLRRAKACVGLLAWEDAARDFAWLRTHASSHAAVRETLPAWERAQGALSQFAGASWNGDGTPGDYEAGMARVLAFADCGLLRNAGHQSALLFQAPHAEALAPRVLLTRLGAAYAAHSTRAQGWHLLPVLAGSERGAVWREHRRKAAEAWRVLVDADARFLKMGDDEGLNAERGALRVQRAASVLALGCAEMALAELEKCEDAPGMEVATARVRFHALAALQREAEAVQALSGLLRHLEEARQEPSPQDCLVGAGLLQRQGKHQAVVKLCTEALVGGRTPAALRLRASSLRQLQQFGEAEADLREAAALEGK